MQTRSALMAVYILSHFDWPREVQTRLLLLSEDAVLAFPLIGCITRHLDDFASFSDRFGKCGFVRP